METFEGFDKLPKINFLTQYGSQGFSDNRSYFHSKNKIIRMYDSSHVIKKVHGSLDYFEMLSKLNIEGVITPEKVFLDKEKNSDKYFITTKYVDNAYAISYLIYQKVPFERIINIMLKIIESIKKCHQENFFLIDINSFNTLISKNNTPYLIDFDTSCFIKGDNLIANVYSISNYVNDEFINLFLNNYYYEPDMCWYNCENHEFIPRFILLDKVSLLIILKDYLYYKLGIEPKVFFFDASNIGKVGLSKDLTTKLTEVFEGEALDDDDYLEDELHELLGSRFVRKKKFN